ncbi:amino acid adenylation domain-containing protein [Bacillus pretiosus]|uniref:amino acid adenylation domain-containing protein n=1 Tax=Bacillus pretiosus TaxID=2983392 RepID=UPI003D64B920
MQSSVIEGYHLSPQQRRLWKLQEQSSTFSNCLLVRLKGTICSKTLQLAVKKIMDDHEIFRSTLQKFEELVFPVQVVQEGNFLDWSVLDMSEMDEEVKWLNIKKLIQKEKATSLHLEEGRLLRAVLVHLDEKDSILVLNISAFCIDRWAMKSLVDKLGELYAALLIGEEVADEILQYGQYAEWQNELLAEMEGEEKSYWTEQVIFPLNESNLPLAKSQKIQSSGEIKSCSWILDREIVSNLKNLGDKIDASVEEILFAGWHALMSNLSGKYDLIIGFGVDGRNFEELEGALGIYGKYLPIKGLKREKVFFGSHLKEMKTLIEDGKEWQSSFWFDDLNRVIEEVEHLDYFPIGFDYLDLRELRKHGDVEFLIQEMSGSIDRFDLCLSCLHLSSELKLEFTYDSNRYDLEAVEEIASYYSELLKRAEISLDHPLMDLELLDEAHKHQMLEVWNDTTMKLPGQFVHKAFEEQAEKKPNDVAIVFQSEHLTYGELNICANRLAHRLRKMGVGADTLVAICVEPSLEMIVGILGVLKSGGAYLPIDPSYPKDRIRYMLEDSQAPVLLTQQHLASMLPEHSSQVFILDSNVAELNEESTENPEVILTPNQLAYVIYTSGSTGKPKGTLVRHEGFSNYLEWAIEYYEVEKGEGAPLHSSIAFDLTVTSLFAPLMTGKKVIIVKQDKSLEGLIEVLCEYNNFSFVKLTPAHLKVLSNNLRDQDLSGMFRKIIIGGEALNANDIEFWRINAPETVLYNEYGPTETVVGSVVYEIPSDTELSGSIPIGRPIANAQVYLLDENRKPVPRGVKGEIYIGGKGVARGYLNQSELTKERFLVSPFKVTDRIYKTGDIARYLPNGDIEYIGRLDDQVKIRGYRIELSEIESAIAKHPVVKNNIVVTREDVPGENYLVAYIVTDEHVSLGAQDLLNFLSEFLPNYMLPSIFVSIEELPLTSNGKVDKKALPNPKHSRLDASEDFIASRSEEEEMLVGVWSQVLDVEKIGIDDNYFALGGDSIRSIQVVARAQERGIEFSVEDMFKYPTIRSLLHHLRTFEYNTTKVDNVEPFDMLSVIDRKKIPNGIEDAYPLTLLQEGMIFHSEFSPDTPIYHDITSLHIKAPFEENLLRDAIDCVVKRHATLRTSYDFTTFSKPIQLVHEKGVTNFQVDDITHLSFEEQEIYVQNWLEEEKGRGFDWRKLPLLRFHAHRRCKDSFQFTVSFHHAILDGWSEATMLMEMFRYYLKLVNGETPTVEELSTTFRDFVHLEQSAIEESQKYWDEKLENMTLMKMPRWKEVDENNLLDPQKREIHVLEVPLSDEVSEGIKKLAISLAIPLKNVLLAAHMRVLNLLSNQSDVLTCVVSAGRPEGLDGESVLGLFINSLPFRMNLEGGTWNDLALSAFDMERESLPYRRYPMAEIKRRQGGQTLSETLFYFTHYHVYHGLQELPGIEVLSNYLYEETSFPLASNFFLDPFTNHVHLKLKCDTNVLEMEQIQQIGFYYLKVLTAMASDPEARYEQMNLLSEAEHQKVLVEWNNQETKIEEIDKDWTLVHMFEKQVEKNPNATAVSYEGYTLTYAELNERANRLAHYLQNLGVGTESLVGLCMDRSLDTIVSILGIQKAGGAYVPLDVANPKERLAYILQDSNLKILVTKEELLESLPEHSVQTVCLDKQANQIIKMPSLNPKPIITADNLAYIIYTSGSTGQPKGVLTTHRNVVRLFTSTSHLYEFNENDVWTMFHSYAFDFAVWEMWGAILHGGKVVVVPQMVARSSESFYQMLVDEKVTVLNQTPSAFRQLMNVDGVMETEADLALRYVIFGGEALDIPSLKPWFDRHGDQKPQLINMYGITETTVHVTYRPLSIADLEDSGSVIGKPIPDLKLYLLDSQLNPIPVGVPGEIHVGGAGLARGYLNREELTKERFIQNPFLDNPDEFLYKSGDMARYLPNGDLEYVGRIDDQVKIRGYRIELGEIQSLLSQYEEISESTVIVREDIPGDKRLVAYVLPTNKELTIGNIRQYLSTKLPDYMVPSAYVLLEEMPLTTNGKINRGALPKPSQDRPDLSSEYVAPKNGVEELIAGTWSSILEIEQVGMNDNFFELGGHSLLATQVVSMLRDAFLINLPLRALFEAPTVRELSVVVEKLRNEGAVYNPMPVIVPNQEDRYEKFPLTDIQQAYWIGRDRAFELGNAAAHIYLRFEANGLDVERMNMAIRKLIERHDMLRAIIDQDGQQQILENVPAYEIKVKDLSNLEEEEALIKIEEERSELSHQVFETSQWPLFEIRANLLDEEYSVLHVSIDLLITDADSLGILSRELGIFYLNPEAELPKLDISFRDYVLGELDFRKSEKYQESLDYWTKRIKTLPPAPEMPLIQGLEAAESPEFVRYKGYLEEVSWKRLKARAARVGVTPSGVLLAAYSEVLRRWAKKTQFTINVTTYNCLPLHPQAKDLVGDFTSLTLLGVDSEQPNFEELAKSVQKQFMDDLDHNYVSGIQVMRELARVQGNPLGNLMPVVFTSVLPLHTRDGYGENPIPVDLVEAITQSPQLLIDHQVSEEEGVLHFRWDVLEHVFPEGYIREMFGAYSRLLHLLAEDEGAWLEPTLQLLPETDVKIQEKINATEEEVSKEMLHSLFGEQVALHPNQQAIVSENRILTYEELFHRSNQLGRKLREQGVRPNNLVAVVMEKGWEQAVATLGILQAGGAYLPIDPNLPQERLQYLFENGDVEVVLTQTKWKSRIDWPSNIQVSTVEDSDLEDYEKTALESIQSPEDLAYVIFTSGSTGQPKGVMIDHRGAVNTILDINERFGVRSGDKAFAISALNFDLSVYDLFGMLAVGGTLVFPDPEGLRDPSHWSEVMKREGVTIWNSAPALMEMLVDYADGKAEVLPDSLRLALLSGDWIPVNLPDRLREMVPSVNVISLGGATEASIWSILYPIDKVDPKWTSIPYGKPMKNQRFYVLNEMLEPCPTWVPGQLYIGGIGLAKGYWKDEVKTQVSFIEHPITGERLYKTGDNGRYLPDGNIEFLGREDFQVKIQGHRIELGEIESVLSQHDAVRNAVVHAAGSQRGNKRLIGYIVLEKPVEDVITEFHNYLQDRLPAYMVPKVFMPIDSVPLSTNGKVNRKLLPEPKFISGADEEQEIITRTEAKLIDVWQKSLNLERVEKKDNFFDLGGDSIIAIQLMSKIKKIFGVEISPRMFFENPTIAHLAKKVDEFKGTLSNKKYVQVEKVSYEGKVPLSFAQQRLWALCKVNPNNSFYNIPVVIHLNGQLDLVSFHKALNEIVNRHEILRTGFKSRMGEAKQVITPKLVLPMPVINLDAKFKSSCWEEAMGLVEEEVRFPFDLEEPGLIRFKMIRLAKDEYIFVMTMHHIITDAWSIEVFLKEMLVLYEAAVEGKPIYLPELEIQYVDFAFWQHQWLQGKEAAKQLDYWKKQLSGPIELLNLPISHERSRERNFRGGRKRVQITKETTVKLQSISKREGSTLFMVMLAMFNTWLYRYTQQEDFVVSTSISNRQGEMEEKLIGFFLNNLSLRNDLSGNPTFLQLIGRIKDTALDAYINQDVPFERVAEQVTINRQQVQSPLTQVVFGLRNQPLSKLELSGVKMRQLDIYRGAAKFEMEMQLVNTEDGITGMLEYNAELFEEKKIEEMLAGFHQIVELLVDQPDSEIKVIVKSLIEREAMDKKMERKQMDAKKRNKLLGMKTKKVQLKTLELGLQVEWEQDFPLILKPNFQDLNEVKWLQSHKEEIEELMIKHGGVRMRGFSTCSSENFQEIVQAFSNELLEYKERSTPRSQISGKIYTSTEYPEDQYIPLHNENSYSNIWPQKIWFYCHTAAVEGGATPIGDSRKVYELIDPIIRETFEKKKVMYVRNYGTGLDLSWQQAFQTEDKVEVEEYCKQQNIEFEWLNENRLRTRQVRQAIVVHPKTGEKIWFNQAHLFHVSNLPGDVRKSLLAVVEEEDLPRNAFYGDGTEIEEDILESIREAYRQVEVSFPWEQGDMMLLDNMLMTHGRAPFKGERKVMVSMSDPMKI